MKVFVCIKDKYERENILGNGLGIIIQYNGAKLLLEEEGEFSNFILVRGKKRFYDLQGNIKRIESGVFAKNYLVEGNILYCSGLLEIGTFYKGFLVSGESGGKKKSCNIPKII